MEEAVEPGELRDGRYVIPSDDDHYGPTVISTTQPRRRDFLRVLFGRWHPELLVRRSVTLKGASATIRKSWVKVSDQLNKPSPWADPFKR